jgi:hypothetical protein
VGQAEKTDLAIPGITGFLNPMAILTDRMTFVSPELILEKRIQTKTGRWSTQLNNQEE